MVSTTSHSRSRSFLVLGSTIAGACLTILMLPSLFDSLPNELMRTQVLLKSLHGEATPLPKVAVLGNSIAMNGINTKLLGSELPDSPVAWNLSSTGQLLIESTLIVDELPDQVDAVILTLFTDDLIKDASQVPRSKLIAYLQYGYQPSNPTLTTLRKVGSPDVVDVLSKSKLQITLESRWAIRSAIDISSRQLLRKDLDLANAATNLFYPSPFTKQQSLQVIETVIERSFPQLTADQGHLSQSAAELLTALAGHLAERKIAFYIALLPEHPLLRQRREDGFYDNLISDLNQLGQQINTPVFSFVPLLKESQFIDQVHPNAEGAQLLTKALAKEINKLQPGGDQ